MTDHEFRTEYKASENSVPVNTELKAKLIKMAEEIESKNAAAPNITLSDKARKTRLRRIIAEISAIAACAAVCAYTIPKMNDRYIDITDNIPAVTDTAAPHSDGSSGTDTNAGTDTVPDAPPRDTAEPDAIKVAATKPAASVPQKPKRQPDSANPTPQTAPDNTTAAPAVDPPTDQNKNTGSEPTDDPELNARLAEIPERLEKLDDWNDTIAPYKTADATINGYYESFVRDSEQYRIAAGEFEFSYGSATESAAAAEGEDKYDTELDGIYFENCRKSYRKAKNYIEIMQLSDEEPTEHPEAANDTVGSEESGVTE